MEKKKKRRRKRQAGVDDGWRGMVKAFAAHNIIMKKRAAAARAYGSKQRKLGAMSVEEVPSTTNMALAGQATEGSPLLAASLSLQHWHHQFDTNSMDTQSKRKPRGTEKAKILDN